MDARSGTEAAGQREEARLPVVKPILTPVVAVINRLGQGASFGLGEVINLSVQVRPNTANVGTFGGVRWAVKTGSGTLTAITPAAGTAVLTIGGTPGTVELVAYAVNDHATLFTKKITAVAPTDVQFTKIGNVAHTQGLAEAGFIAELALLPVGVSFQNLVVREGSFKSKGSGSFAHFEGLDHPAGAWLAVACNPATGANSCGHDRIHSGTGNAPYTDSSFEWYIPWLYRVGAGGTETNLGYFTHQQSINAAGRVEIQKHTSGKYGANLNDPTTTFGLPLIGYP